MGCFEESDYFRGATFIQLYQFQILIIIDCVFRFRMTSGNGALQEVLYQVIILILQKSRDEVRVIHR